MKTLVLQIFGLVFNLFLVFIIVSYSRLGKFPGTQGSGPKFNNITPIITNG